METKILKFKTNINCPHCLAKVTPVLNAMPEIEQWKVDLDSEEKILTVEGEVDATDIQETLRKTGYQAEVL